MTRVGFRSTAMWVLTCGWLLLACGPKVPPGQYHACMDPLEEDQSWGAPVHDDVASVGHWALTWACDWYAERGQACPKPEHFASLARYMSARLEDLDEPYLGAADGQTVYRLLGHDDYNGLSIRVVKKGDRAWLVMKGGRLGGVDQRAAVQNIRRSVRLLSRQEWDRIEAAVEGSAFWRLPTMPAAPKPEPVPQIVFVHLHGHLLTSLEAVSPRGHHLVFKSTHPSMADVSDVFYSLAGCPIARP